MEHPKDLFDREQEWADLSGFVSARQRGLGVGIVFGRRRQGKSFLLRRLCAASAGLYTMALEESRGPALERFGNALGAELGLGTGQLRFADWDEALRSALGQGRSGAGRLLVLDELPYLLRHSPEIPSVLQRLFDEARDSAARAQVIVCGSALSVMSELLSGTKALRGRARLELRVSPFDFRTSARFWGIADHDLAFRVHAIFGGTPGYVDLVGDAPERGSQLGEWLAGNVLNPSHALFGEADYLLREDPRVTDRAVYHSILTAIAGGASTPRQVGERVGRDERSLPHPLEVLLSAGFIERDDDVLLQRRPRLRVTDPIVRFSLLVIAPRLATFEERHAADGWRDARETFDAQVLGPHFEQLARIWTSRFASSETFGAAVGEVGSAVVNDPAGRSQHQVDVVALARGQRRQAKHPRVIVLGEAKYSRAARTLADVSRLEHVRRVLVSRNVDAAGAVLAVFAPKFNAELRRAAQTRRDLVLVDLDRIYAGS